MLWTSSIETKKRTKKGSSTEKWLPCFPPHNDLSRSRHFPSLVDSRKHLWVEARGDRALNTNLSMRYLHCISSGRLWWQPWGLTSIFPSRCPACTSVHCSAVVLCPPFAPPAPLSSPAYPTPRGRDAQAQPTTRRKKWRSLSSPRARYRDTVEPRLVSHVSIHYFVCNVSSPVCHGGWPIFILGPPLASSFFSSFFFLHPVKPCSSLTTRRTRRRRRHFQRSWLAWTSVLELEISPFVNFKRFDHPIYPLGSWGGIINKCVQKKWYRWRNREVIRFRSKSNTSLLTIKQWQLSFIQMFPVQVLETYDWK
jgi:hypothetical protein